MRFKGLIIACLSLAVATGASAQVEYDDMYFNSADRKALNAARGTQTFALGGKKKKAYQQEDFNNPTDSYSARNINPEHISRSNADEARAEEQDYYVSDYNRKSAAGYSAWHNQFNSWYNSPWYSTGWYGASRWGYSPYYSGMYSPYWGSRFYDPFYYDPFYDPFYPSYGMGYGPSWNVGFSFGSMYRPWYWGMSAGYGWYNSWYPRTIVIVDNGVGPNVRYGKRSTRGSATYNNSTVTNNRSRNSVSTPTYGRSNSGGRATSTVNTAPTSTRQSSYYNKNWRSASQTAPTRTSTWSGSNSNSRSSYNSGSSYDRGSSRTPSYSPSPQRSYSGGSSGSSGSSGGGSNGRTRGGR